MSRKALLLAVAWACGCGGVANHGGDSESRDAGDADAAVAGAGGALAEMGDAGGQAGAPVDTSVAAGAAEAGAPTVVVERPKSGRRLCLEDLDCDALTCTPSEGRDRKACLAPCSSDADCRSDEHCFQPPASDADAAPPAQSCFQSCDLSPTVCAFQFDCADYYRVDKYSCLPTEWVRNWPPIER